METKEEKTKSKESASKIEKEQTEKDTSSAPKKADDSYMKVYEKQSTEKAVRGTQLMLQYVANKGIKIDPEIINTLTLSKERVEKGFKLNAKEEANFWIAYTELSTQIQPVTVKSLKCIREEFGVTVGYIKPKKISFAERVQGFYRRISIGVLILALIMQVLWLWQNYILKETTITNQKLKAVYEKEFVLDKEEPNDLKTKLKLLGIEKIELKQKLKIQKENLELFIGPLQIGCQWIKYIYKCSNETKKKLSTDNEIENAEYRELFEEDYLDHIQVLNFYIEILTLYLLPLAYGLLGSCTFILRVIAHEIEKNIYIREHDIQYALRLLLGAFAGLVIGWFISSDAEVNTGFSPTKLSPFAIAFLAGYSVELLFTMMDKIVSVYSGTSKKEVETKSE